jgi:HEAT repeat protein
LEDLLKDPKFAHFVEFENSLHYVLSCPFIDDLLIEILEKNNDYSIRANASLALGKLKSKKAIPVLVKTLKGLQVYLERSQWQDKIREEALNNLTKKMRGESVDFSWRERHVDDQLRINSAKALRAISKGVPEEAFIQALNDKNSEVRAEAIEALANIGTELAIPSLVRVIEDLLIMPEVGIVTELESYQNRGGAVLALGKIGSELALHVLIKALKGKDRYVRNRAATALGDIGSEMAVMPLIKAIHDPINFTHDVGFFVRRAAIQALAKINNIEGLKFLADLLTAQETYLISGYQILNKSEYSDSVLRQCAAEALSRDCEKLEILSLLQKKLVNVSDYYSHYVIEAISGIQNRCQFYNYEIFCSDPKPEDNLASGETDPILSTLKQIEQGVKTMSDQPQRTIHAEKYFEKVDTYHEHNYAPSQNFTEAAQKLTQVLNKLRQEHPNATDTELFQILINGFEAMPQKNPQRWQSWQDIFSVLFSGGVEATKVLVPVAGIPIEVGKRLYEIYDRNRKQLPPS